jgi:hypothetical protein
MLSPAKIFVDTEFTDLSPVGGMNPPKLISIGAVVLDEDRLFYAEASDTWRQADCSEWVCENVLPLLQGNGVLYDHRSLAAAWYNWIKALGRPVSIYASSAYDHHFAMGLFAETGIPDNLQTAVILHWPNLSARSQSAAEQVERRYLELRGGQHHALCDALAYREGWRAGRGLMFSDPVGTVFWHRSSV